MDIVPNIIYDDRYSKDYPRLLDELIRQGVTKYRFWNAIVDKTNVTASINASHKMIVRWAKENNLDSICIWEQDNYFPSENGWRYFKKNIPEDFDVYIGGTYLLNAPHEWVAPVIKVNEWVGNHCIIINKKYYDIWLSLEDDKHIDSINAGKGDFYVCYPFAALQRPGYSLQHRSDQNYNAILKEEYVYGKLR